MSGPAAGDAAERERLAKLVEIIAGAITAEDPGSGVSDVQISATHVADLHRAAALLRSSAAAGGEAVAYKWRERTKAVQGVWSVWRLDFEAPGIQPDDDMFEVEVQPLGVLGATDAIRGLRAAVVNRHNGLRMDSVQGDATGELRWVLEQIDSLGKEEADGRDG